MWAAAIGIRLRILERVAVERGRAAAEDALQDSLVRAWRGLASFAGLSSLRTWLYRVTTNACLDLVADRCGRSLPSLEHPRGAVDDPVPMDLEPVWLGRRGGRVPFVHGGAAALRAS